jgi:hypothetical protein
METNSFIYEWIMTTTKENVHEQFPNVFHALNICWERQEYNECLIYILNLLNYSLEELISSLRNSYVTFDKLKSRIYRYYEHLHLIYCLDIKSKESIINLF